MLTHITNSNFCIILIISNIALLRVIYVLLNKIKQSKHKTNDISEYVTNIISTINSVRYGNLIARLDKHPNKDLNEVSKCINRMIETLNDREKMIVEYQNELRKNNEFLETVINSLSDGLLVLDEHYKITKVTKNIQEWIGDKKKLLNKDLNKFIKISNEKEIAKLNNDEIFIETNTEKRFTASTIIIDTETHKKNYLIVIKDDVK